jgi:hypothetical protein
MERMTGVTAGQVLNYGGKRSATPLSPAWKTTRTFGNQSVSKKLWLAVYGCIGFFSCIPKTPNIQHFNANPEVASPFGVEC